MQHQVKPLENSRIEITMTFTTEEWKVAQNQAFKKLAADVKVDGFRPGKAPEAMIRARLSPGKIYDTAINAILPQAYSDVLKADKLTPLSRPAVDVVKVSDTELVLKAVVILVPEVKVKKYKDLGIKRQAVKVTDADVEAELKTTLAQQATLMLKEGAAALGDSVVFDFEGFVNNVAFEGGKAENYTLELGSGQFIPGFEEQMVGLKAGDQKDLKVKFPENYAAELASKDAIFKIKVHEVKSKQLPELNEALFTEMKLPNVKTEAQFRDYLKQKVTTNKTRESDDQFYSEILMKITKEADIDLPHEAIHEQMDAMKADLEAKLKQRNQTIDQYLKANDLTEAKLHDRMHQQAEDILRASLVANKIAEQENIEVTDELVDFEIAKIAEQYKMEFAKVKEILTPNIARFRAEIRDRYIKEFLIKHNS
ncbi:MAG: trigger factor [Firmicutes bacterium]|nr:trigger factor [Bacillota bacterium]